MSGRCDRCQKKIRIYHGLVGLHCVWCHLEVSSEATPPASASRPLLKLPSLLCQSARLPDRLPDRLCRAVTVARAPKSSPVPDPQVER